MSEPRNPEPRNPAPDGIEPDRVEPTTPDPVSTESDALAPETTPTSETTSSPEAAPASGTTPSPETTPAPETTPGPAAQENAMASNPSAPKATKAPKPPKKAKRDKAASPPTAAPTTRAERLAPHARRRSAIRIGSGVVGFAVAAAAVAIPLLVPFPTATTAAEGRVVTPTPAESRLVCSGDFIDASDPETLTAIGGTDSNVSPSDVSEDAAQLAQPDVSGSDAGTRTLTVPASDNGDQATPAGVVTQVVGTETLGGLTASACGEASADSWIVAGSTDVGNSSVLVLANPSEVPATVDLTIYGENGPVDAAGSTGIVVPAETVRAISVAGLAPDLQQPVVRVVARGGEITASLQSSAISGLTPVGVEVTGAGAVPATSAVIPGFTITSPTPVTASDDGAGSAGSPVLRVLAPGDVDATVTVRVSNEDPSGSGTSTSVVVPAGRATEVPLAGLSSGSYSISLSADQPIVASGRTTSTGDAGTDYAWFVSSRADTAPFTVANTGAASSTLHLRNDGQQTATITIETGDDARTLEVGPATAVAVEIDGDVATVSSDQELYASVSLADAGRLASYPVLPPSPLAAPLTVYDH